MIWKKTILLTHIWQKSSIRREVYKSFWSTFLDSTYVAKDEDAEDDHIDVHRSADIVVFGLKRKTT